MQENTFYHIYNRGNNKENIFKEDRNYQYFLDKFSFYLGDKIDIYAYCLMPNHFHFLIKTNCHDIQSSEVLETSEALIKGKNKLTVLEKAFKDFFICYSKSINKLYNRTGSLFQAKFKKRSIINEEYLLRLIPYIHNNPVRAGLVNQISDWEYSSYNDFINHNINKKVKEIVLGFFGSVENFVQYHDDYDNYQKEREYLFKEIRKENFRSL